MGSCYISLPVNTMQLYLTLILTLVCIVTANTWPAAPYTLYRQKRSPQSTKFFTGNSALDAGAAGAAFGVATQYLTNQLLNPCNRNRGGTSNQNQNPNTRFFGGQTLQNGALGFAAGYAGSSLVNNFLGNPCGK